MRPFTPGEGVAKGTKTTKVHKGLVSAAAWASCAAAHAQAPDVMVKLDLRPTFVGRPNGSDDFRTYDILGRPSTVGLFFSLEPGFNAVLTQRLERIPNDPDKDQLDEYYVEDPNYWRAGKQYLPFGLARLLRESVVAIRVNVNVGSEAVPAALAACDGGNQRQKGFVARLGERLGLSVAIGEHFAISGTALTLFRRPEESPGMGRGYRQILGSDYATRKGNWGGSVEVVSFQKGETSLDRNFEASDLHFFLESDRTRRIGIGWSRDWRQSQDTYRVDGRFQIQDNMWLEPTLRMRSGNLLDFGITVNAKW